MKFDKTVVVFLMGINFSDCVWTSLLGEIKSVEILFENSVGDGGGFEAPNRKKMKTAVKLV